MSITISQLYDYSTWSLKSDLCKKVTFDEFVRLVEEVEHMTIEDHPVMKRLHERFEFLGTYVPDIHPIQQLRKFKTAVTDKRLPEFILNKYPTTDAMLGTMNIDMVVDDHPIRLLLIEGRRNKCKWLTNEFIINLIKTSHDHPELPEFDDYLELVATEKLTINDHINVIENENNVLGVDIPYKTSVIQQKRLLNTLLRNADELLSNPKFRGVDCCSGMMPLLNSSTVGTYQKLLSDPYLPRHTLKRILTHEQRDHDVYKRLMPLYDMGTWSYIESNIQNHNPFRVRKLRNTNDYQLKLLTSIYIPESIEHATELEHIINIPGNTYQQFRDTLCELVRDNGITLDVNKKLKWNLTRQLITKTIKSIPTLNTELSKFMELVDTRKKAKVSDMVCELLEDHFRPIVNKQLGKPQVSANILDVNEVAIQHLINTKLDSLKKFCKKFGLEINDLPALLESAIEKDAVDTEQI